MMTRLPSVLSCDYLPLAELHAARLDGELVACASFFTPIDEPADIGQRARLLANMGPDRMIAEKHSAAWVWGVLDRPPFRQQFCVDAGARISISSAASHQLREVVIDEADIARVGELRLTTPIRTAIDIARTRGPFDVADRDIVASLMLRGGFGEEECASAMNKRRNLPRKSEALARLRESEQRLT
ncbi:MAG: type IV toxin-antitoxin system AbiEi family antitoxin [Lacisediminihabitans sp.]